MDTLRQHTETLAAKLEELAIQFENKHGIDNIIMYVDGNVHFKNFVQNYQTEIRMHSKEWPYSDSFVPSYIGLIHRFYQTSVNYVENADNLFTLLKSQSSDDLYLAYEIAVFSEAARGREGKRSKIGLDNQQEILIAELTNILNDVWSPDIGCMEDKLNIIVQTVLSGHSSAAELPEKFISYIEICNQEVTLANLENTDNITSGLLRKLLREFCCYSLGKFNTHLNLYRAVYSKIKAKANIITAKRAEKIQLTENLAERIEKKGGSSKRFLQVVQQIDHLNFLNDNIDVKYSFKSWPGLIHWNVFANVIQLTGTSVSLEERGKFLMEL
jgi:hypothetical protein